MARDVTTAEFDAEVLDRSLEVPVVVDFWAEWCAPCRALGPVLERVAGGYVGRIDLVKVDTDANQDLAVALGIQGIPAVKAFREGAVVDEFTGAVPEATVRAFFEGLEALERRRGEHAATIERARTHAAAGERDEARRLLSTLPADAEVSRLLAEISLAESDLALDDPGTTLAALLDRVRSGDRVEARERMVEIFEVLGPDHPLTRRYRAELASTLF